MTKIKYTKLFLKQFSKLRPGEQQRFFERLGVWRHNPTDKMLNNHKLQGRYKGLHSINVGGDLRACYREMNSEVVWFELIGTHSQLYG